MQVTWYNLNRFDTLPGQIAAYQGDCLLLTDIHGNMTGATDGFYFRRTRFLSAMRMQINDRDVQPISATQSCPLVVVASCLVPVSDNGETGGEIAHKAIAIRKEATERTETVRDTVAGKRWK